jgi:integrase
MGRKRAIGNERLGEYVHRRSSGILEVRFPLPEEVRHAFPDARGRPRTAIIKSLGTNDTKIANAKAEAIKTQLRADIRRASEARGSTDLSDFLQWLHDYDLSSFAAEEADRAKVDLRDRFTHPDRIEKAMAERSSRRNHYGAALTSHVSEERRAVTSWAADEYFRRAGREPDDQSPEYIAVLEECGRVLVDGVLAQEALAKGSPVPPPLSKILSDATARNVDLKGALTDRGRMRLTVFFEEIYAKAEERVGAPKKGERNIPGKRHSVRLFSELVGDKPICAITKGDLYAFLDELLDFPESRRLTGPQKKLKADALLRQARAGEISVPSIHAKTANKHLSNLSAVLQFAERRRDVNAVDSKGVKARFEDDEDDGRPFTTAELNRIFSLPPFAGCAGDDVEGGLLKCGPVKMRDDRFWIPLILLFTGARSSEIAGLLTSEVVTEHETPHFVIIPNVARPRLKNRHSRRLVPIHSRLIDMGLLDFVGVRRAEDSLRLFPLAEQTFYRDGTTGLKTARSLSSSLILRQFNRTHLKRAEATADRGSIKCFRNSFEQEAAARIQSDETRQRLTGRKVVSTSRIYTDNIPYDPDQRAGMLARLKQDIECIVYATVKLDHLLV